MHAFIRLGILVLGALTALAGVLAMASPGVFSDVVAFPPHTHFVHDVGAFQLGIGATVLLALIWPDSAAVALAGYVVGGAAHTASHVVDADLGGSAARTVAVAVSALLAAAMFVVRWRELGWVLGEQPTAPPPALAALARHKTVTLTSFRADGTPVTTPVSIVVVGGRLCARSFERAGKIRRIRNNPNVTVAPSTARGRPTGSPLHATARLLTGAEARLAGRALRRKYPLLHGVLVPAAHRVGRARTGRTVHLELIPQDAALRVLPAADAVRGA